MSGAVRKAFVPILVLLLAACSQKRPPVAVAPVQLPQTSFSASLTCTAAYGRTNVTASGGCALDPTLGARIELRDPFGAARLLLLVSPDEATLLSVVSGRFYTWSKASREMPWSAADLWAVLSGRLPREARSMKRSAAGLVTAARWRNADGRIAIRFSPSRGSVFPYASARLKGPHSAVLDVRWSRVKPGRFEGRTFSVPPGLATASAPPADILGELLR